MSPHDRATAPKSRARSTAQWIERRSQEQFWKGKDLIVLGDFNIPSTKSVLFEAITSRGLHKAPDLTGTRGSNLAKNKRYDQILHDPRSTQSFTSHGGVLDFYRGDHRRLYPGTRITKAEFTWEMSDHLPLWIQVATDVEAALANA